MSKHETPKRLDWLDLEVVGEGLEQLHAMLVHTTGDAFEPFNLLSDRLREAYLIRCSAFARDLQKQIADIMESAQQEVRNAKAKG